MNTQELAKMVLEEANKGNVVIKTPMGVAVAPIEEFVSQPIDGLLYDLNRMPEVVMTFLEIPEYGPKWINDYAVYLVIKRLKEKLAQFEALDELTKQAQELDMGYGK